ncbi:acylphosphatase [Candidatus Contubernalis alkaliaceticus]|uniref:acylphosphatase n=1 Tax=Candidatus Contubernalis alkaliaceticus TaxID=338645 RepID=UPI001F4C51C8|nr:acylphosphatase [Candidatus Contubernalis alkalaceticus]UNC91612.1 acylphosphatase [Candidatus Contubernalis alkalaceticus]
MERVSVHVFINGLVQGVYFRKSLKEEALKNNVTGWARNLPDSRVEAVLQGRKEDVKKVVNWAKHGPPRARVTEVEEDWQCPAKEYKKFRIR